MAFPRQFLDELVSRCDIVDVVSSYVALQHKGSNYFGLCPFHNEKTGSFSVSRISRSTTASAASGAAGSSASSWRSRGSASPTRCASWPSGWG